MVCQKKPITMILPLGLIAGMALTVQGLASDMGHYAIDSSKAIVVDGAGNCVRTIGGVAATPPNCGMEMPKTKESGVAMAKVSAAEGDADGDGVVDSKDQCPDTPAGTLVDARGCALDSDGDGVHDYRDNCPDTPAGAKVDAFGCEIVANVTIDLVSDSFDFDSAVLKAGIKAALQDIAAKIKASPGDESITIVGHTDSIGSEAYNQALSERRAQAVADYLSELGLDAGRLSIRGMGETSPVAGNDTPEGRARNRRVEIQAK